MQTKNDKEEILAALIEEWGYLMPTAGIKQALGMRSYGALRNALAKDTLPFDVFKLESRKGIFARTHEVATWLAGSAANSNDVKSAIRINKK